MEAIPRFANLSDTRRSDWKCERARRLCAVQSAERQA